MRDKKCKAPSCGKEFTPRRPFQQTCDDIKCALEHARFKKAEKLRKDDKKKLKSFRDNDLRLQKKLTQKEFNKLVRYLDKEEPCRSCGNVIDTNPTGGSWDCGHFKTIGGFPELRFCFLNAYKQCKSCNSGSYNHARKGSIVSAEYERRLIEHMGQEVVDWLNGPHEPAKHTCDELIQMRAMYTAEQRYIKEHGRPSRDWRKFPVMEMA